MLTETAAGHYQCTCYDLRCRTYTQTYHDATTPLVCAPLLYRAAATAIAATTAAIASGAAAAAAASILLLTIHTACAAPHALDITVAVTTALVQMLLPALAPLLLHCVRGFVVLQLCSL